jgi:hypothetical protein
VNLQAAIGPSKLFGREVAAAAAPVATHMESESAANKQRFE